MALACSQQARHHMGGLEQHGSALGSRQYTGSAGGWVRRRAARWSAGCSSAGLLHIMCNCTEESKVLVTQNVQFSTPLQLASGKWRCGHHGGSGARSSLLQRRQMRRPAGW